MKPLLVKTPKNQTGLSLIELMVSLLIGLILMTGVFQIFINSKTTYTAHDESLRLQENLRFANHFLSKDLRSAGYLGCTSNIEHMETETIIEHKKQGNEKQIFDSTNFNPGLGIQGWEASNTNPGASLTLTTEQPTSTKDGGWTSSGSTGIDDTSVMPGSDLFRIWRAENPRYFEVKESGANPKIKLLGKANIADNTLLTLSDCVNLIIVARACDTKDEGGGTGNSIVDITPSCGNKPPGHVDLGVLSKPAEAMTLSSYIYYIGKRGNIAANPPSLFRRPLKNDGTAGDAEELIEGVENMQILYGIDTNGNREVDSYVSANAVTDWRSVVSIKVALLLASADNVRTEASAETYDLLGVKVTTPNDRRLRRVMSSTIALRNRSL